MNMQRIEEDMAFACCCCGFSAVAMTLVPHARCILGSWQPELQEESHPQETEVDGLGPGSKECE